MKFAHSFKGSSNCDWLAAANETLRYFSASRSRMRLWQVFIGSFASYIK